MDSDEEGTFCWPIPFSGTPCPRGERQRLNALRTALLVLKALGHDRRTEPAPKVFGQFVELRVAVDLDGLLGGIANDVAVVAPGKMIFQLDLCFFVENAVQIAGQLIEEFRTFHRSPSPLATSLSLTSPPFESLPRPLPCSRR